MDITEYKIDCLGSSDDERDVLYRDIACASGSIDIPYELDIPYQFNPKDQGTKSTCVSHATSEALEIVKSVLEQISTGWINGCRRDSDWQGTGMIIREALVNLTKLGYLFDKDFSFNEDYPAIKTIIEKYGLEQLLQKASANLIKGFVRLYPEDFKRYMATEKKPIIFSVRVYENFYEFQNNKGIVPSVPNGKLLGAHCMLGTGYKGDMVKTLNSWGNQGDNGYLHIDVNSSIIIEAWGLTDEKVYNPMPTPQPKPTPIPTPFPTTETIYRVQLGAFKNRKWADQLANELRSKDIDCCLKVYPDMFKIQVGVYKIKSNAQDMLNKMISLGYSDAFIVECK